MEDGDIKLLCKAVGCRRELSAFVTPFKERYVLDAKHEGVQSVQSSLLYFRRPINVQSKHFCRFLTMKCQRSNDPGYTSSVKSTLNSYMKKEKTYPTYYCSKS